jgi:hypothetical protein
MDLGSDNDRLALVVHSDDRRGVAHVLLVSPLIEYRTAADCLLAPVATGASMPLLAECDLRGAVWYAQLGAVLGAVEPSLAARLDQVGAGDPPGTLDLDMSPFGLPVRDERDTRWAWKLAELTVIQYLANECEEWLLSEEPCSGVVDPALILDLMAADARSPEVTEQLFSLADAFDTTVPESSLDSFVTLLAQTDPDTQAALAPLLESSLAILPGASASDAVWRSGEGPDIRRTPQLARIVAQRAVRDERCVVVVTSSSAWGSRGERLPAPAIVEVSGRQRVQVRPVTMDLRRGKVVV